MISVMMAVLMVAMMLVLLLIVTLLLMVVLLVMLWSSLVCRYGRDGCSAILSSLKRLSILRKLLQVLCRVILFMSLGYATIRYHGQIRQLGSV